MGTCGVGFTCVGGAHDGATCFADAECEETCESTICADTGIRGCTVGDPSTCPCACDDGAAVECQGECLGCPLAFRTHECQSDRGECVGGGLQLCGGSILSCTTDANCTIKAECIGTDPGGMGGTCAPDTNNPGAACACTEATGVCLDDVCSTYPNCNGTSNTCLGPQGSATALPCDCPDSGAACYTNYCAVCYHLTTTTALPAAGTCSLDPTYPCTTSLECSLCTCRNGSSVYASPCTGVPSTLPTLSPPPPPTPVPPMTPPPTPIPDFTGSCCHECIGSGMLFVKACSQPVADNVECQANGAAIIAGSMSFITSCTNTFSAVLPCSTNCVNSNAGGCCPSALGSTIPACVHDSLGTTPCSTGYILGGVCCTSGFCAGNIMLCGPNGASFGDDDAAALTVVDVEYAEYAKTLCRVLNACGDGDEPLCASPDTMDAALLAHCQSIGCCSVEGVPEQRRRRK